MRTDRGRGERRRPLRILHLVANYDRTTAEGIQSYTYQLGRALAERGHDFHVLACTPGAADEDYLDGAVRVHRRTGAAVLQRIIRGIPWTSTHIYQALSHQHESERLGLSFDVVESPDWGACGLLLALRPKQALVVRLHTPLIVEAPFYTDTKRLDVRLCDWLERALVKRATLLTAATGGIVEHLKAIGWLGDDDACIVRSPTDFSFWERAQPVQLTEPIVLVVGRIESRKAPELLVRAVSGLKDTFPDVRAMFLGRSNGTRDGIPYRAWVTGLARELDAPCQFINEVPRDQLPSVFGRARVVAIPSWQEGFSYAGLEAMAAGRPIVCTSTSGISELIEHTRAGNVVPPGDEGLLAAALVPYLRSAERAAEAGRCGRNVARAACAPPAVAHQTEECYYEAIRRWEGQVGA